MDEPTFSRVLYAKAATSVALARVFGEYAATLDFVLFFSSMMSFTTAAGQSNYAAGCAFADAFADRLRADWPCPVKVINWGYWGSVGAVSDARYRERMAALGLGSIGPEQGMRVLAQLLGGERDQVVMLNSLQGEVPDCLSGLHGERYPACAGGLAAIRERLLDRLRAIDLPLIAQD